MSAEKRLNDLNLKFTIPEPYAPFLDYLTFGVLPKHMLEGVPPEGLSTTDFNINPIGSGPYQFDHLILNQGQITGVVLTSFENYYGKKPFIPQVVFRYFPSSAAALDAYEQGEVLGVSRITNDVLLEAFLVRGLEPRCERDELELGKAQVLVDPLRQRFRGAVWEPLFDDHQIERLICGGGEGGASASAGPGRTQSARDGGISPRSLRARSYSLSAYPALYPSASRSRPSSAGVSLTSLRHSTQWW